MAPNIITIKDLSYLSDIYGWNFITAKYINDSKISDEQIINLYKEAYQMHKSNCMKIINILGGKHEW